MKLNIEHIGLKSLTPALYLGFHPSVCFNIHDMAVVRQFLSEEGTQTLLTTLNLKAVMNEDAKELIISLKSFLSGEDFQSMKQPNADVISILCKDMHPIRQNETLPTLICSHLVELDRDTVTDIWTGLTQKSPEEMPGFENMFARTGGLSM
jgi:hypothetical protein